MHLTFSPYQICNLRGICNYQWCNIRMNDYYSYIYVYICIQRYLKVAKGTMFRDRSYLAQFNTFAKNICSCCKICKTFLLLKITYLRYTSYVCGFVGLKCNGWQDK